MHLVKVFEGSAQLPRHRLGVTAVNAANVVALNVLKKLSAIPLLCGLTHLSVDRIEAHLPGDLPGLGGYIDAPVIPEKLHGVRLRDGLHMAEGLFQRYDEHVAHRRARQAPSLPCVPGNDLSVALVNAAVTVWPDSQEISKPPEHQRVSLCPTATLP